MQAGLTCTREEQVDSISFLKKYIKRIRRDVLEREAAKAK